VPTGGELLVTALCAQGVDVVFGIPGTHNLEIYRHLGRAGMRLVTPRHEQGAGYAADGYARVTGRPGVVVTTSGPGVLNAAAAAGQAYSDSSPVLLVSPGPPSGYRSGAGTLHETKDQSGAMGAICAESLRMSTPAAIPRTVESIFRTFRTGRPRPVHLELPTDVLAGAAGPAAPAPGRCRSAAPPEDELRAALTVLAGAARPAIVAGGGARHAADHVRELAELLGAPVVTTANGKGVVPESHALSLGVGLHVPQVRRYLRRTDVLLAVGTELAETDTWYGRMHRPKAVVRIDIDPDQMLRPWAASHPIIGDAAEVLARLLSGLGMRRRRRRPRLSAVRSEVTARGARWAGIIDALRAALPDDAVLVNDSAQACYLGALTGFPVDGPRQFLYPTGFATLGFALPAAVGAAVGAPDRAVAALTGDGGLQFSIGELATAVDLGTPLPVVVVTNGGYAVIRQEMVEHGIAPLGVDLRCPDFPAVSRAYGGRGSCVSSPTELYAAVVRALKIPVPTLIEIPEPPA